MVPQQTHYLGRMACFHAKSPLGFTNGFFDEGVDLNFEEEEFGVEE